MSRLLYISTEQTVIDIINRIFDVAYEHINIYHNSIALNTNPYQHYTTRRMASSGMLRRVALVRTNV
jgi:hypothetical protein